MTFLESPSRNRRRRISPTLARSALAGLGAGALLLACRVQAGPVDDQSVLGSTLSRLSSAYSNSVVQVIAYRPVGLAPESSERYGLSARLTPSRGTLWSTGVVIDRQGHILACTDGAQPDDSLEIRLPDGERRGAQFVAQDVRSGLSLLRVADASRLVAATRRISEEPVRENDWVVVLTQGGADEGLELRVGTLARIVPATSSRLPGDLRVRLDEGYGCCGGLVLDGNGGFLGMVVDCQVNQEPGVFAGSCPKQIARRVSGGTVSAITRGMLLRYGERLQKEGANRVGFLGVQAERSPQDQQKRDTDDYATLNVDRAPQGASTPPVRVARVLAGSPAELAGVLEGDQILEYDGRTVSSVEQVSEWIGETPPGTRVSMELLRKGAPVRLLPRIGDRSSLEWMEHRTIRTANLQKRLRKEIEVFQGQVARLDTYLDRYR
jgi:S1-C subfamily serine protease